MERVGVGGVLWGIGEIEECWSIFADEKFDELAIRMPSPHGEESGESLGDRSEPERERTILLYRAMERG